MRKLLNTYFSISKREFNGLLALIVLIVVVTAIPYIYELAVEKQARSTGAVSMVVPKHEIQTRKAGTYYDTPRPITNQVLFEFDPNTLDTKGWQKLGLSEKQSAAIINYRAKGGIFRQAEDLRKMYTINEKMYERLLPYAKIPQQSAKIHPSDVRPKTKDRIQTAAPLRVIEINGADSAALVEIKGIGPAFASRIMKYRERIGGFCQKEQLMEVYGLDTLKFHEIKDQVSIDLSALRKIDINAARIEDFKNHPYIRYKQANAIIQFRRQHGNYASIADLSKVLILDPQTINRLAPYLIFSQ